VEIEYSSASSASIAESFPTVSGQSRDVSFSISNERAIDLAIGAA
jgi:hypothetical protein